MAGNIDSVECGLVSGWALDPGAPSVRMQVSLRIGESNVAICDASQFRQDLLTAGKGDGNCGFTFRLSEADWRKLLDHHKDVSIAARNPVTGVDFPLPRSARVQFFLDQGNLRSTFLADSLPPRIQLSAVCIIKDEAHYVEEWIAYHLMKGVQFFLFFDNGSKDNLRDVLSPYIDRGIAKIIDWPNFIKDLGLRRVAWHEQNIAYVHAVRALAGISEWVIVLDIDEFIATAEDVRIPDLIAGMHERDVITLYWRFFGSGGHEARPQGLVIESFVFRAEDRIGESGMPFKFMVRPERVGWILNTHIAFMARDGAIGENLSGRRFWTTPDALAAADFSALWIHHYHVKSKAEYRTKVIRGWPENTDSKNFDWEQFFKLHDRNEIRDASLLSSAPKVLALMAGMTRPQRAQPLALTVPRNLILQWTLTREAGHIGITGIAFDCADPGARVRIEVQDLFGATVFEGLCDQNAPFALAYNFCDGRMGFTVSVSVANFPEGQLRILFNGIAFVRCIPSEVAVARVG